MNISPGRKKLLYRITAVTVIIFFFLKIVDVAGMKIIQKGAEKFSEKISAKTGMDISITGPGYKLFPLKLTAQTVSIFKNGKDIAMLSGCSVDRPVAVVTGRTGDVKVECGTLSFNEKKALEYLKAAVTGKTEKKNGERSETVTSVERSLDITIGNASVRVMGSQESFWVNLRMKGREGVVRIKGIESVNVAGFVEVVFSLSEKKADIRFDNVSLKMFDKLLIKEIRPEEYSGAVDGDVGIWKKDGTAGVTADLTVTDIMVEHPLIDNVPYKLPFLRMKSEAEVDLASKEVSVRNSKFSIGGIEGSFEGTYGPAGKSLKAEIDEASLNKLETLVHGDVFKDFNLAGHIDLSLNYAQLNDEEPVFEVKGEIVDAKQLSDRFDYLVSSFPYSFTDNDGDVKVMTIGPASDSFVPIEYLPEHVYWAVVISEDAGFFMHPGIDFAELGAAVIDNIKNNKLRGGSTITQQLAKNLFLNRQKTLIRKFQEMLLAVELDSTFSKNRLLEMYLNMIEWAPGIFGISQAAHYYFDKSPYELTPLESAYLASVIPGPYKYHYQFLTDTVNDKWMSNLHRILNIMQENGHITFEQYVDALGNVIVFREKK
ncbi:MAG TPA: biosynthetic peptidoglycan transglycosylase [bacterium]|nr:biosynthetic peptidoglycan transglycosylase [bacterium]